MQHSATQDVHGVKEFASEYFEQKKQQSYFNKGILASPLSLNNGRRVSVHQIMQSSGNN